MADRYVPKGTTDLGTITINSADSLFFGEGEQTVSSGTNLSALAAGLVDVTVNRAFTGNIVDLRLDITNLLWYDAGGGSMSIIADGTATEIIAKVWHTGLGTLTFKTAGTVTNWEQISGTGYVEDTGIVTNVRLGGGVLNQKYHATANTAWTISGGILVTGRGVSGTANIGGGTVIVRREDSSATVPTGGTLNIVGPAKVVWQGGNITALNLLHPDAVFDPSQAPAAFTITDMTGFAKAIRRSGLPTGAAGTIINKNNRTITLTNAATQYVGKAEIYAATGAFGGYST